MHISIGRSMRLLPAILTVVCVFLISELTTPSSALSQSTTPLTNGDFETGNLNGWQVAGDATVVQDQLDMLTINALHSVAEGKFAARIGDEIPWQTQGPQSSSLTQEVIVPPVVDGQRTVLQFAYAVVADDPPSHADQDKPLFRTRVINLTTQQTLYDTDAVFTSQTNGQWYLGSGPSALGSAYTTGSGDRWVFRQWTPVDINLKGMEGNQIRVEFTVRDCNLGAHAAYGYLDAIHIGTPQTINVPPLAGNPILVQYQGPSVLGQLLGVGERHLGTLWWLLCLLLPLLLLLTTLFAGYKLWTRVTPAGVTDPATGPARRTADQREPQQRANQGRGASWRTPPAGRSDSDTDSGNRR